MNINSLCPLFKSLDDEGIEFDIANYIGKKTIVIFFYPKDDTPGCTIEACSFRDQYNIFSDLDCKVIGISSDSVKSHQNFKSKYNLPYTLLSDPEKKIRSLFKVPSHLFGLIAGRVSYVIDKKGMIKGIFNSQLNPTSHVKKTINCIIHNKLNIKE